MDRRNFTSSLDTSLGYKNESVTEPTERNVEDGRNDSNERNDSAKTNNSNLNLQLSHLIFNFDPLPTHREETED